MGLMVGWPMILVALMASYIFGSLTLLPMVAFGIKKMRSEVPFGVFLTIATIFALLLGEMVMDWYVRLLF